MVVIPEGAISGYPGATEVAAPWVPALPRIIPEAAISGYPGPTEIAAPCFPALPRITSIGLAAARSAGPTLASN